MPTLPPPALRPDSNRARIIAALRGKSGPKARRRVLDEFRKSIEAPRHEKPSADAGRPFPPGTQRRDGSMPMSVTSESRALLGHIQRTRKAVSLQFPDGLLPGGRIVCLDAKGKSFDVGSVTAASSAPRADGPDSWGLQLTVKQNQLQLTLHAPGTGAALRDPRGKRQGDLGYRLKLDERARAARIQGDEE